MNKLVYSLMIAALALGAGGCNSNPPKSPLCTLPSGNDLQTAMSSAKFDLNTGCASRYEAYFDALMKIAAANPEPDNRKQFSDFLQWSIGQGLQSKRQAQERYNRYFNVKYVSLMSDYSVCSETCPNRTSVLSRMSEEREDKKLGLLKISKDRDLYQRADRLYHETELVLEATCNACGTY